MIAHNSKSYPTMAAGLVYGIPGDVIYSFGWGIILTARGMATGYWERYAHGFVAAKIGAPRCHELARHLGAVYRAAGVIP